MALNLPSMNGRNETLHLRGLMKPIFLAASLLASTIAGETAVATRDVTATVAHAVRLTLQERVAPVRIRELSAFYVNRPVPKQAYRPGTGLER